MPSTRVTFFTALAVLCTGTMSSCYYDKQNELYPVNPNGCDTTLPATYTAMVAPVIGSNCAFGGCHVGSTAAAGYDLSTHAGLSVIAQNGRLMKTITHAPDASPMPKNLPKLSNCDIGKIDRWVKAGAPNN
jgi:hypothetical protein